MQNCSDDVVFLGGGFVCLFCFLLVNQTLLMLYSNYLVEIRSCNFFFLNFKSHHLNQKKERSLTKWRKTVIHIKIIVYAK